MVVDVVEGIVKYDDDDVDDDDDDDDGDDDDDDDNDDDDDDDDTRMGDVINTVSGTYLPLDDCVNPAFY